MFHRLHNQYELSAWPSPAGSSPGKQLGHIYNFVFLLLDIFCLLVELWWIQNILCLLSEASLLAHLQAIREGPLLVPLNCSFLEDLQLCMVVTQLMLARVNCYHFT